MGSPRYYVFIQEPRPTLVMHYACHGWHHAEYESTSIYFSEVILLKEMLYFVTTSNSLYMII